MSLYIKKCTICNNDFETNRSHTLFCSTKCSSKDKYNKNRLRYERVCEYCSKTFNSPKKDTRFCSSACINTTTKKHDDVENICLECNNTFVTSYIKRHRKFCSRSCATKNANNNMSVETKIKISNTKKLNYKNGTTLHPFSGKTLTSEHKDKISNSRKINGSSVGEKNPMYGKNHTTETKEKISVTRIKKMINGEYNSWFCKGTYFSTKTNKDIYYKSSWEMKAIQFLDKSEEVHSFMYEPFSIPYYHKNNKRHYIPDLLITYINGKQKIIEIKPSYFLNAEVNLDKFESAQKYCNDKGIVFEVWTEKTITNLFIAEQ